MEGGESYPEIEVEVAPKSLSFPIPACLEVPSLSLLVCFAPVCSSPGSCFLFPSGSTCSLGFLVCFAPEGYQAGILRATLLLLP